MNSDTLKHILYTSAVVIFLGVMIYMFFYNSRSKARQARIEGDKAPASKEAGILEAQEAMKRDRQAKH